MQFSLLSVTWSHGVLMMDYFTYANEGVNASVELSGWRVHLFSAGSPEI
jgi:hypothetical protein